MSHRRIKWWLLRNVDAPTPVAEARDFSRRMAGVANLALHAPEARRRAHPARRARRAAMMIKSLRPAPVVIRQDGVARYLLGLSALCAEVARESRLLPTFVRILARVPATLRR
jgi:hypothetical protein